MKNQRLEIASRILAGFASNPAVFAPNPNCGWCLVNFKDEDLAGYSLALADKLIEGERVTAELAPFRTEQGEYESEQDPLMEAGHA